MISAPPPEMLLLSRIIALALLVYVLWMLLSQPRTK